MGFVGDEDQVRGDDHLYSGGTCWYSCSVFLMHTFFFWAQAPKKSANAGTKKTGVFTPYKNRS